jgi:WD40 repeat protein
LLPGSERWSACTMRPGEHPVEAARAALRTSADDPFTAAASDLPDGGRLIVVVDQFEEVFTTCASEAERSEFLDLLARAAARDVDRCCVVATMRSDFYGRLADHPQVAELFRDNHVLVGPLSRDELRRAITLPARRAGLAVEAALADALVAEAADGAGSLPLLSTALVELWQGRTDRWLRMPAYRESGGLEGAVARLAEASYAELSEVERAAARRVMLRLGTSGEGEVLTRRRVAVEEFDLELDPAAGRVIDRFTGDRLLTAEGDTIEVAHEALLRDWPRLEGWLSEDQQGRQLRQHVTQAARAWSAGGREPSELYRGARLTATLDWAAEHGGDLNELEREFLAASRQAADQDAQAQRRTNRRLRGLLAGVAVLLVLAVVAGVLATVQRSSAQSSARHARRQANRALAQSLGAQAVAQPRTDLAMLLALEAVRLDPSVQTRADLLTTLLRTPSALRGYHGNADRNNGLLLSPDGKSLAIVDNDHHWIWRDVATGRETRRNRDELLGFAPDGTLIDAGAAGSLVLRDPGSYEVIRTLAPPRAAHGDPAPADPGASLPWSARVLGSADGGHAVLVNYTHAHDHGRGADIDPGGDLVAAVRLSGGGPGRAFRVPPENTGLYPLRHGRQLLVVQPRSTYVVDTATGRRVRTYRVGADTAAVAPDSRTVALAHSTGALQLLDLRTGRLRQGIGAVDAARMLFTPDGRTLVVAGEDGVVQLWDVAAGDVRRTLAGHAGAIHGLAMSADGRTLYTGSFDTNVLSWDLTGSRGLVRSLSGGDADPVNGAWTLAVAPDNRTIAEGAADGDVVLTDLVTRRQLRRFHVADSGTDAAGVPVAGLVSAVSFSPDGRSLLVSGVQGPRSPTTKTWLEEWSVSGRPRLVRRFDTTDWPFLAWSAWSPDGRTVAAVGHLRNQDPLSAGAVGEWDAATGEPLAAPMRIKGGYGTVVAFAPHGTEIAVGGYGFQSFLADPARGAVLATLHGSGGPQQYQQGIAFSPDGSKVATAQFDGTLRIWRAADGRQLAKIQDAGQGVVEGVAWSPDGTMLAATDWEPSLRLYDVGTRQQVGPAYPLPALPDGLAFDPWVVFTPNGEDVVVSGTDDKTFVVPVTVAAWSRQACALAGRNLTRREWAHYVPGHAYERICPAA